MDSLFNFNIISNESTSVFARDSGFYTFNILAQYVQRLPYGRNSDKSILENVIREQKGTCSTKHAFLAQIAIENTISEYHLILGVYKMNSENTNGIQSILNTYNLDYIPEAHCYLKFNNQILDFTRAIESNQSFKFSLLEEEIILPPQIVDYKIIKHQDYLKKWIDENNIPYNFKQLWEIREKCIAAISNK